MRRREFIALLGGATTWPLAARAQQAERTRRIGVMMGVANDAEGQARIAVFRRALEDLGWVEGHNVQFDYRWAPKDAAQARLFAKELVDLRPDLIFTQSTPTTVAAKEIAGGSIPIVFVQVGDPVVSKVVEKPPQAGRQSYRLY